MVLKHFKGLWKGEVPENSASYNCTVSKHAYFTSLRYNLLFHLAGKHKQLKEKLVANGISREILAPTHVSGKESDAYNASRKRKNKNMDGQTHFSWQMGSAAALTNTGLEYSAKSSRNALDEHQINMQRLRFLRSFDYSMLLRNLVYKYLLSYLKITRFYYLVFGI